MVEFDPPLSSSNKGLGVCIPDHAKQKVEEEDAKRGIEEQQRLKEESRPKFFDEMPRFEVEGVYGIGENCMLKGYVLSGRIAKGSKLPLGKKTAKVKDLQYEGRSVKELSVGQRGAIFFGRAKGILAKEGDILELENVIPSPAKTKPMEF